MVYLKTIRKQLIGYWFAADQGAPSAQIRLGMILWYGRGVLQEYALPICGTAL